MAVSWLSVTWALLGFVTGAKSSFLVWSSLIGFVIPVNYNMLFLLFLFIWKPTSSLFPNKDFIYWSNLDSSVLFFTISNLERKKNLIFLPVVSLYNMLILLDIFFLYLTEKIENDFHMKSRQNPMVIVSISKFKHLFLFPVYDEID